MYAFTNCQVDTISTVWSVVVVPGPQVLPEVAPGPEFLPEVAPGPEVLPEVAPGPEVLPEVASQCSKMALPHQILGLGSVLILGTSFVECCFFPTRV